MSQQALKKCGDPLASDAEVHTHVEAPVSYTHLTLPTTPYV